MRVPFGTNETELRLQSGECLGDYSGMKIMENNRSPNCCPSRTCFPGKTRFPRSQRGRIFVRFLRNRRAKNPRTAQFRSKMQSRGGYYTRLSCVPRGNDGQLAGRAAIMHNITTLIPCTCHELGHLLAADANPARIHDNRPRAMRPLKTIYGGEERWVEFYFSTENQAAMWG